MSTLLATAAVDEIARRATEHQRDFHRVITACGEWSCDDVLALCTALREAWHRTTAERLHRETVERNGAEWRRVYENAMVALDMRDAIIADLEAKIVEYQKHPETHLPYKDMHAAAVARAEAAEKERMLDNLALDAAMESLAAEVARRTAAEAEAARLRTERDALARGAVTCWREVEHLQARLVRVTALVEKLEWQVRYGGMVASDVALITKQLRAALDGAPTVARCPGFPTAVPEVTRHCHRCSIYDARYALTMEERAFVEGPARRWLAPMAATMYGNRLLAIIDRLAPAPRAGTPEDTDG